MSGAKVVCVLVEQCSPELGRGGGCVQFFEEVHRGEGQLEASCESRNKKKEQCVLASRMGIRAGARHRHAGDSEDVGISCGPENNENAIHRSLHESERLGGCTTEPASVNGDCDHS